MAILAGTPELGSTRAQGAIPRHPAQDARSAWTSRSGVEPESFARFAAAAAAVSDGDTCVVPIALDVPDDVGVELAFLLSEAECRRAARFFRVRDRRRYIVAHGRLRQLLAQRLEIRAEQVALGNNRHGRPELVGRQADSGWYFNISYSDGAGGALALCALSRHRRIGVDVESVRSLNDAATLARQFFSPREFGLYRQLPPEERPLGFFYCWTRKEALAKAMGVGLSMDLTDFDVSLTPGLPARILRLGKLQGHDCGWYLESIGPAGGRVAAVVTEQAGG